MKKYLFLFLMLLVIAGCEKDLSPLIDNTVTPTAADSLNLPFEIKAFSYLPTQLTIRDTVLISVGITNSSVAIKYFSVYLVPDSINTLPEPKLYLLDNGVDGDLTANDSVFSGYLRFPLSLNFAKENQLIIKAVDAAGKTYFCTKKHLTLYPKNDRPILFASVTMPDTIVLPSAGYVDFFIFAKAYDPQGPDDISSVYFIKYNPSGTTSGIANLLYDNGVYPDAATGDSVYSGGFSAPYNADKGTWRFAFIAKDKLGALSDTVYKKITLK